MEALDKDMEIAKVRAEMNQVFAEIPDGIEHTERVLRYAEQILDGEVIPEETRRVVVLAALLHDIGVVEAQRVHGSMEGRYQELEGPPIARGILERAGVPAAVAERVCAIVGSHHTLGKVHGIDFQVLWEADTLENLRVAASGMTLEELSRKVDENFRTSSGIELARKELGIDNLTGLC